MSGQFNFNKGYDVPPPTSIERNCQPPTEETVTSQRSGSYISTHHTNLSDRYNAKNPLVTGHESSTSRYNIPYNREHYNTDIVPERIHPYDGYKVEIQRLETFYDWPSNAAVTKEDLARNGFIYTHSKDRTQCVFCRGVLSSWEPGDNVENEHKKHCPECPMAFGYECGNVPLNPESMPKRRTVTPTSSTSFLYVPASTSIPSHTSYNTTVKVPVESCLSSSSVRGEREPHRMDIHNVIDSRPYGSSHQSLPPVPSLLNGQPMTTEVTTATPKYRDWGDEYKRIRSFRGWPTQMTQTPIDLAKAGLLYMGNGDRCKCFWCGGELYDWEPQDEPWEEHAKWFPHCGYVRAMKGDKYIQYVKDKQNGLVVDPPVHELMKTPHVLAVLSQGYTPEEVEEAFNRFGRGNLVNAQAIVKAIEDTKKQRQRILRETNTAGTQETGELPNVENMEISEPGNESVFQEKSTGDSRTKESTVIARPSSSCSVGSNQDVERVLLENEKLKDMKLCKICMDNDLCMTFLPCGHLATCEGCSVTLKECPICRKEITQRVKVFWA